MQDIPRIGLGTWSLTGEEGIQAIQTALSLGYTHIDTAQRYENEEEVGRAWTNSGKNREDLWFTTKIFYPNYGRIEQSFEESLQKLRTDYVDLLLFHRPVNSEDFIEHERLLNIFMKLLTQGRARRFGISNFTFRQMEHAWNYTNGKIFTNQIEYHIHLSQDKIKSFADDHGILITAYSPLGHNGYVLREEKLQPIVEKYNVTVAQVCLARLLQQGCVVIPRSKNEGRMKENLASLSLTLDEEDLAVIASLPKHYRYINPPFAPKWDE